MNWWWETEYLLIRDKLKELLGKTSAWQTAWELNGKTSGIQKHSWGTELAQCWMRYVRISVSNGGWWGKSRCVTTSSQRLAMRGRECAILNDTGIVMRDSSVWCFDRKHSAGCTSEIWKRELYADRIQNTNIRNVWTRSQSGQNIV